MKTVFSNDEIVHVFAKQNQFEGRTPNGNLFFEYNRIYSYGHHFCIAQILDNNKVIFNSENYSISTSQHVSSVRYALNHLETVLTIPYPDEIDNNKNFLHCLDNFNELLEKLPRARSNKDGYISGMVGYTNTLKFLLDSTKTVLNKKEYRKNLRYMNTTIKNLESDPTKIFAKLKKIHNEKKLAEKEEKEEIKRENLQKIEEWKNGERNQLSMYIDTPYLRISADKLHVETSKGADVPINSAKILWSMIKAKKDIIGHEINGFTVISLNGSLKIGCHNIPIDEVNRFGAVLDQVR